jgi:uncharacterized membrane protein
VASVLALPFLRTPAWFTAIVAAAVIVAPWSLADPMFDHPWLWRVGLSTVPPVTIDYVPVFPWFGAVLAGIVLGRLGLRYEAALARIRPRDIVSRTLMLAGRWSLVIYLVHQPLVVAAIYAYVQINPPSREFVRERWAGQCTAACVGDRSEASCQALCGCLFDGMYGTDLYSLRAAEDMTPDQQTRWDRLVDQCRAVAP